MNTCRLCDTENTELTDLTIDGYGAVGICLACITDAVARDLRERDQADHLYCQPCQHYTVDNQCRLGLTPRTCC